MMQFALTGRQSDHFYAARAFTPQERAQILQLCLDASLSDPYFNIHFAVSEDLKKYLLQNFKLNPDHISLTVNGVDTARFSPEKGGEELRKTSNRLILDGRVDFATEADYREGGELDCLIKRVVDKILSDRALFELHKEQYDIAHDMIHN